MFQTVNRGVILKGGCQLNPEYHEAAFHTDILLETLKERTERLRGPGKASKINVELCYKQKDNIKNPMFRLLRKPGALSLDQSTKARRSGRVRVGLLRALC